MEVSEKLSFAKKQSKDFYSILKERVEQYFMHEGISKNANAFMVFKTIFILFIFFLTYGLMLSNLFDTWVLLILVIINGFFTALIGLNIGHDAIHGSYSSNHKVNKILSLTFNIVGANDYMWRRMHNVIHHTYTNVPDHDDDINQIKFIRLNPQKELKWFHRFQHIYVFLFYPLASLSWVFIKDYAKFFRERIGSHENRHPRKEYYRLFFYKIIYYISFLVIPLIVIQIPWYQILFGFAMLHFVEGLTLALVFQLAHVVEGPSFPQPDESGKLPNTWAVHQVYTTANFACKSRLAYFICGGLNFQIEHHLFPRICHIHYKKISKIVKQTTQEFNLPYYENTTFLSAVASHIRMLKRFGREQPMVTN